VVDPQWTHGYTSEPEFLLLKLRMICLRLVTSQRMRTGWVGWVFDSPTGGSEFEMRGYSLSKIKSKECSKEAPVMDIYIVGTNKNRRVASRQKLHCAMLFHSIVIP